MATPKDCSGESLGYDSQKADRSSSDYVDLDELLRSIDKELGDFEAVHAPDLLDYDIYEDIFGAKKEKDPRVYSKSSANQSGKSQISDKMTQETRAIPVVGRAKEPAGASLSGSVSSRNDVRRQKPYAVEGANKGASPKIASGKAQKNPGTGNGGGEKKKFRLTGVRYILFVFIVSFFLASAAWISANDIFALNKPLVTATVTIPQNFTMSQVASELKKAGIIEYKLLFRLFGAIAGAEKKIDPGMYKLTSELDYRAIVTQMQAGSSDEVVKITVAEGKTLSEIFSLLEEKRVSSAAKLKDAAANYDFEYKFLDSSTLGNESRLEGYLFPDTYEFYVGETATSVIKKFLDNFNTKVTEDMYAQAKKLGYSMSDIIKIASLVEKESANESESSKIASVIYNRLKSSSFPYLQIDATVQYALPERKAKLTNKDIEIDSPYNTYKYKGLPPTAIANPGIKSINAALYPASTNYYFYALHKNGSHSFFASSSDFDKFVSSADYGG